MPRVLRRFSMVSIAWLTPSGVTRHRLAVLVDIRLDLEGEGRAAGDVDAALDGFARRNNGERRRGR